MIQNYHTDQLPSAEWTLSDWIESVGSPSIQNIIDEANKQGITPDSKPFENPRITDWKASGIPRDDLAYRFVATLSYIAHKNNGVTVFRGNRLTTDVRLFLVSKACKQRFAEPDSETWQTLFRFTALAEVHPELVPLYNQVQPPPPGRLFGRKDDLDRALSGIDERAVTIIDGIAGDGKTALAWHVAQQAYRQRLIRAFDWQTDKRAVVDIFGNALPTHIKPLNFESLLIGIAQRFDWGDILHLSGERLEDACADRLRQSFHLIVIDNLETVEACDLVTRRLNAILHRPSKSLASRALLTSREHVILTGVEFFRIDIHGIDHAERIPYMRHLERTISARRPLLADDQLEAIARATDGNPLFMQVVIQRYALAPNRQTFDQLMNELTGNMHQGAHPMFIALFQPLFEQLKAQNESAVYLAVYASANSEIHHDKLKRGWRAAYGGNDTGFEQALRLLVQHRILNPVIDSSRYVMHSLIQTYLRSFQRFSKT